MKERYLIVFWISGKCNLNCIYCYAQNACIMDMDFITAKTVIDNFKSYPLKIQFAGGEPTLNFALIEKICEYIKHMNINAVFQMQSNGTLITDEMAEKIKKLNIAIGISLDGIPEINELTRGKSSKAIQGILNLKAKGIMVNLNAVVTSKNIEYLPKLVDFAMWLGNVGGIGLDLLRNAGGAEDYFDKLNVCSSQLETVLIQMYQRSCQLYKLCGRKIYIREIEEAYQRLNTPVSSTNYCYANCGRSVVVLPNGKTYPCGSLINNRYFMGNTENLKPEKVMKITAHSNENCKTCEFNAFCPKGCPSRVLVNNALSLDCVLKKTAFMIAKNQIN